MEVLVISRFSTPRCWHVNKFWAVTMGPVADAWELHPAFTWMCEFWRAERAMIRFSKKLRWGSRNELASWLHRKLRLCRQSGPQAAVTGSEDDAFIERRWRDLNGLSESCRGSDDWRLPTHAFIENRNMGSRDWLPREAFIGREDWRSRNWPPPVTFKMDEPRRQNS